MGSETRINADAGKEEKGKPQGEPGKNEHCRCEETSKMTPRQLLNLMMRDLAFWKKPKKDRT